MMEWAALYKIGRLGLLAFVLSAIAWRLYVATGGHDFEEPARRMLEEEDVR
jgi:hypothetical protein